ncbi:MAG: autotransporter outer membrane beta-barrel domain-containing protein [Pseudomonas sp.]|uniref:autotransporter outer membrane beta-barrel domain-containing protein n=1 Tax=Pseudomonas sp. TaxID=306 RepID=UPI003D6E990F
MIRSPEIQNEKTTADILIANHSILEAGNGRLVDVKQESSAKVEVNDSALNGDFVADDTSTLNVILRNHGRLDGNIINGNSLIIDSSGHWQLQADNEVKSLAIDGGSVGFSEEGFHTLTLGQLSGRGRFDMRIDLANAAGDLLNVEGEASGNHLLNIRNTGEETVPSEFDALRVVHTEGGDAQFRLRGARADLGAYSYELEQQGTDWFIVGSGKIISPSTESALALFNVGPTIWNSELSTLRSRMGEVRGQEQGGGWMRSYGSRFNASLDSGLDYRQKQRGLSFGADAPVPVSDGQLLVGLMGGYSKSDLDMGRGTSGEVDSYYIGAYGTWLSEDGYYLDGVVKVNQFHNASKVAMSDGEKAKGDYSNMAVGGSVEFGKHIKLPDDYFVAPFAQLSSVWIGGDSYTLDNGLQAKTSQTQSILGKVGATLGRQFTLADGGVVQPYVRVAGAHEFSRSNDVRVNDQRFDNDLFGSRAELGAGVSVSLSERLQVHADFDYMKGKHVEQPWGANVGLRLAF